MSAAGCLHVDRDPGLERLRAGRVVGVERQDHELGGVAPDLGRALGLGLAARLGELGGELLLFGFGARQERLETFDLGVFVFEGAPEDIGVGARRLCSPVADRGGLVGGAGGSAGRVFGLGAERADEALGAVVFDHALRPLTGQQRATAGAADGVVVIVLRVSEKAS